MPPRLGIIAGRGELPARLLRSSLDAQRPVFVLGLIGQTDPGLVDGVPHRWVKLGALSTAMAALHEAGVEEVVFAGGVRRPSLLRLGLDARAARLLARFGRAALGDDRLLRILVEELEGEGFRVVGADSLLDDLLVHEEGPLGRYSPDETALRDIGIGSLVARRLGELDVGQAVIVQQGIVIGVEGVEGTDALIDRCRSLQREGPGGVLVKLKKPSQERRVDLPTVGCQTIERAVAAGLRGIAIERGGTLVMEREAMIASADRAGLFVVSLAIPSEASDS